MIRFIFVLLFGLISFSAQAQRALDCSTYKAYEFAEEIVRSTEDNVYVTGVVDNGFTEFTAHSGEGGDANFVTFHIGVIFMRTNENSSAEYRQTYDITYLTRNGRCQFTRVEETYTE
jgi:hypothetical protein